MKYKVGDKVRIKPKNYFCSVDGFNNIHMKDEFFNQYSRLPYCETVMTIGIVNKDFYIFKEDRWAYKWTDEMIEGLVEEEAKPKFKVGDKVKDKNNRAWYVVQVGNRHFDISCIPNGPGYFVPMEDQDDYELFLDKEYPKTYEECCKVLMGKTDFQDFELVLTKLSINRSEENSISPEPPYISLINAFYKLLICRNAYWKIAGEEMGLGKPWKPDWLDEKDKFITQTYKNEVGYWSVVATNSILAFPTPEMRDAFYENFKKEIETVKELL